MLEVFHQAMVQRQNNKQVTFFWAQKRSRKMAGRQYMSAST